MLLAAGTPRPFGKEKFRKKKMLHGRLAKSENINTIHKIIEKESASGMGDNKNKG